MKKKKGSNIITVILFILLLAGLCLLLYPTVSNYWNSLHQSRAIASYAEAVADIDNEEYERMLDAARVYNTGLVGRSANVRMMPTEEESQQYNDTLDISGTGIMGYIEIEAIGVSLPIYHGTSDAVLQVAVGHIEGTSLPVGGESTHCVLSGHRGLPSATLFTHLDKLTLGDTFIIRTLDETLTYEVDQIRIVLPSEVSELEIIEGEDLCTLITCTPYGINTHRLLVRGHRIENAEEAVTVRVTADAVQIEPLLMAPFAAMPILLLLLILLLIPKHKPYDGGEQDDLV